MILTITSALSLFLLIALSTVIFFAAKKFHLPYTVLLVLVGLVLVPVVNLPYLSHVFGFIGDLVLTPELLFYIFLPVLIFESGFNMNVRKMLDSAWAISLLAVVSLLISAFLIATTLYFAMPLIGIELPFIVALLFGAIISPTDPVAVLSLFKECGVPRRLAMIFEGESLMNDGTAMAFFMVVLGIALEGYHGVGTIAHGVFEFTIMIVLGVIIGLAMAGTFAKALDYTRQNDFVTVTLLIISAHLVFITSELINHSGIVHVSPIIATTVAALFLGNYSRSVLRPDVDEYLGKLIEHMAFVINSLVFLMAGLLFASSGVDFLQLWLPILLTVLIVAAARVISVYAMIVPLNATGVENAIPKSWTKLLAWASLRGALSIIIVLLIPETYQIEGWTLDYSPRDFLLALTIGCILATLFIKAPLITPIMRKLKIDIPEPLKVAHESDLGIYYLLSERAELQKITDKGFIETTYYQNLITQVEKNITDALNKRTELVATHGTTVFDQSLHLSMVHIEKRVARKLLNNGEISERTYRKIMGKLSLQQEKIESAQHNDIDPKAYTDRKDVFDHLVRFVRAPFRRESAAETPKEKMAFYRAQMIMARKAIHTIERMQTEHAIPAFLPQSYETVRARYQTYLDRNVKKMEGMIAAYPDELSPYMAYLAERALACSGHKVLDHLHKIGLLDEATEHDIEEHYATA
jgi:CPA1 family monovalent cation:H+ antiporter